MKNKANKKSIKSVKVSTRKQSDLISAVKEMRAHRKGEISLETRTVHVPGNVDVASIRKNIGLTQKEFAEHYGFKLSAIKEWEQGRRKPERSTRILLKVIAKEPKVVERALQEI